MKRIEVIDALRGFALLGILLVNIGFFNQSLQAISLGGVPVEGWLNHILDKLLQLFVNGKFILLFSFLFGYGAIILLTKATIAHQRFGSIFTKRMLALLFFGLLHGIFIWYGDILTSYAIIGLVFLLFIKRSTKTMLVSSILFTLLIPVLMSIFMMIGAVSGAEEFPFDPSTEIQRAQEQDQQIYGEGAMLDILAKRILDYQMGFFNMILFFPQILGTFLLGAYCGKKCFFENIHLKKRFLIKFGIMSGSVGIALEIPMLFSNSTTSMAAILSVFIGAPLLMLSYVSFFTLLFQKYGKQLRFFTYPGRLAFSMYILQSILCSFVFYSYGLGLFGKMELWQTTLTAILLFILQIGFSFIWLKYFKIGPLEYVWRLLYRGRRTVY